MKEQKIKSMYKEAKEKYSAIGVDVDEALKILSKVKISVNCWQGDDIQGFMFPDQELTGGISVSGNYPGKAQTISELRQDLDKAFSLIPGVHKLSLHSTYVDTEEDIDLNEIEPKHFETWIDWAKERKIGLDFNPTLFSHPMSESGFTLASADNEIRDFWIEHVRRSRKVSEAFGKELGQVSVNNIWLPDGYKDNPIDKIGPRERLLEALDLSRAEELNTDYTIDAVEGKLFGTGVEAHTVGSHEFYLAYALTRNILWTVDSGHFHPTEDVAEKFSSVAPFDQGLYLHVSRPVRWDSDHVVILDEALQRIANTLVYDDLLDTTHIGLDFFDATINRVAAWVIGTRNTLKGILMALLSPLDELKEAELNGDYTTRLALTEEMKTYPFGAVWDYYCLINDVPVGMDWMKEISTYEEDVLSKR
jgi:L-rhamnose isomerase